MMENRTYPLDTEYAFVISGEMIRGQGEDSYYACAAGRAAVTAVFDGCGGIGSRKYPGFREHTGAYMSSRVLSGVFHDWFHSFRNRENPAADAGEIGAEIERILRKGMQALKSRADTSSRISGMLVREFPSTAAIAVVQRLRQGTAVHCFWAGDSRVYLLDEDGLAQLTQDDLAGQDALSNLRADAALTNMIAADGTFELHRRTFYLDHPAAVFAATDGCFGYLGSPMEFEELILSSLLSAQDPPAFERNLERGILAAAGDDYTLGLLSFGFGSFPQFRDSFKRRMAVLDRDILSVLRQDDSEETVKRLWLSYRENYLRYEA